MFIMLMARLLRVAKNSDTCQGPDWLASERTDYKARAFAPVACASPETSLKPIHDTWKWRGPC